MAAKLGNTDVSFRLGAGEVAAVYLGSQEVWTAVVPRTLYFFSEESEDWTELGNWWNDSGYSEAAASLPTAADSVGVYGGSITASGQTVVDFTIEGSGVSLEGTLTVTGNAAFTGGSANDGDVTGNATFNDNTVNRGTVTGTATFTGSGCNDGGTAGTFVPDPPPSC